VTLRDYVRLFRRGWLFVLLMAVIGVGAANVLILVTTPTYTSTASILVTMRSDDTAASLQQAGQATKDRATTYASLAVSDVVLQQAAATARTSMDEMRSSTSAAARDGQAYLDITARATTGAGAQARAQAVAEALSRQAPISDTPGVVSPLALQIVTPAMVPADPTSPRSRNNVFFGLVIGTALGVGAVIVAHSFDDRIRTSTDLPRGSRLATITSLPVRRERGVRNPSVGDVRLESFRHLRANLQFGGRSGGLLAVAGVTSASDAPAVTSQLASVLGEIGLAVVVVDVDLRVPTGGAHSSVGAQEAGPGVADILAGTAELDSVLRPSSAEGVWSISAGTARGSSAQLVSTAAMREFLLELETRYDYVLLACPPVVERSEASVVAALSRGTLLVVKSGATTRGELLYALELLEGVGATSVSAALDHVRRADLGRVVHDPAIDAAPAQLPTT
jgi:succinoglycan biosynthesis transport protein ExoP